MLNDHLSGESVGGVSGEGSPSWEAPEGIAVVGVLGESQNQSYRCCTGVDGGVIHVVHSGSKYGP